MDDQRTPHMRPNARHQGVLPITLSQSTWPRLWTGHFTDPRMEIPCADGGRRHMHRFFELVYIEGGEGWHRGGDQTVAVAPG